MDKIESESLIEWLKPDKNSNHEDQFRYDEKKYQK